MKGRTLFLCDFDGTVSLRDVGHEVIKRFMDGDWLEIDDAYTAGRIGSMAAYRRIASLLRVSREEMEEYTSDISGLDPYFPDFYRFCLERGFDLKIVSDGLDFYIGYILRKHGFEEIQYHSNIIRFNDDRRVTIEFPCSNNDCAKCGTCKSSILKKLRRRYDRILYIGDGYSDICPSQHADIVFGKDILYENCVMRGRMCIHFRNFGEITEILENEFVLLRET